MTTKKNAGTGAQSTVDTSAITVSRLITFDAIEALRDEWKTLHDTFMPGSIHADMDWFLTIVKLGPQPRSPLVLTFRKSGRLVGLIAGFIHSRDTVLKIGYLKIGHFRAPAFSINYHSCMVLGGETQHPVNEAMASALRNELANRTVSLVYVNALPVIDPLYRTLAKGFALAFPPARHMMMKLGSTMEEIMARRGPSVRSALNRTLKKSRLAGNNQFTMRLFTRPEELDTYFADAERVAKKTYQRALGVGFDPTPLHRTQAELAAKKGWFRGHVLYSGTTPVAFQEDYLRDTHVFNPYVGYDQSYRDANPGTLLLLKSWEVLIDGTKAATYDFGFGEGVYKERLSDVCICEGELLLFAPGVKNVLFFVILFVNNSIDTAIKRILNTLGIYDAFKKFWRRKKAGKLSAGA